MNLAGAQYTKIENGSVRPSPEMLEKLHKHLFGNDLKAYDHFVSLVIRNRHAVIRHLLAEGDSNNALLEKSFMPPIYWQESIVRFLDPVAWEARPHKPEWATQDILEEFKTQSQYLRAIRYALRLSPVTVGKAIGTTVHAIEHLEAGTTKLSESRKNLIGYYQTELAKQGLAYFDSDKLQALALDKVDARSRHGTRSKGGISKQ